MCNHHSVLISQTVIEWTKINIKSELIPMCSAISFISSCMKKIITLYISHYIWGLWQSFWFKKTKKPKYFTNNSLIFINKLACRLCLRSRFSSFILQRHWLLSHFYVCVNSPSSLWIKGVIAKWQEQSLQQVCWALCM